MTKNKLKLIGSGNEGNRNYFIFNKDNSFFSSFPLFLIGCGFKEIREFEDYQIDVPDINSIKNKIEYFKNEEYDIDLIYTSDKIILIVRTNIANRYILLNGIKKIANI